MSRFTGRIDMIVHLHRPHQMFHKRVSMNKNGRLRTCQLPRPSATSVSQSQPSHEQLRWPELLVSVYPLMEIHLLFSCQEFFCQ